MTTMTLTDRIHQDLAELFENREVSAAKSLRELIDVSTRGLPQHFVGDQESKTILVMLNPGQDEKEADRCFRCMTEDYDHSSVQKFINRYIKEKTDFGEIHKDEEDHFDIKQAAFLKVWKGSGINLPAGFPNDKKTFLAAKRNVLMQKLQLELIPYCSRDFKFKKRDLTELFPFIETVLEEIFKKKRNIVVFCAGLFERVFKAYNKHVGANVFSIGDAAKSEPLKDGGKLRGRCAPVEICFRGKKQQALIAYTFASQALSRAYRLMERYGEFCFSNYGIAIN